MKHLNKYINIHKANSIIVANDDSIYNIIKDEINRLGKDANLNHVDVSRCTSLYDWNDYAMQGLFEHTDFCGDISKWNVENVTDFTLVFYGCKSFDCDLSNWNVSRCESLRGTFGRCENFNSDISEWDVSNCTLFISTFLNCTKFNKDISAWDTHNGRNMLRMFKGCSSFDCNLSGWDVRNVIQYDEFADDAKLKPINYPKFK